MGIEGTKDILGDELESGEVVMCWLLDIVSMLQKSHGNGLHELPHWDIEWQMVLFIAFWVYLFLPFNRFFALFEKKMPYSCRSPV